MHQLRLTAFYTIEGYRSLPQSLEGTERVHTVKLLVFQSSFSFVNHVDAILKVFTQRKQLREQGLPLHQLDTVFQAIILSRLAYTIPV